MNERFRSEGQDNNGVLMEEWVDTGRSTNQLFREFGKFELKDKFDLKKNKRVIGAIALGTIALGALTHACANFSNNESSARSDKVALFSESERFENANFAEIESDPSPAKFTARLTGPDVANSTQFGVGATDLGISFEMPNGKTAYMFGDSFSGDEPGEGEWHSPVMFISSTKNPGKDNPITFESAAGYDGTGMAPEIMPNEHDTSGNGEFSIVPNDGLSFPETGEVVVSYQSVRSWDKNDNEFWQTNYAGLAYSPDGVSFYRAGPQWENNENNSSPFQMQSLERDGDWVYIASVKAGRQQGPMMLQRVHWTKVMDKSAYKCWNGENWGDECKSIIPEAKMGEPSISKLEDGVWAMTYLNDEKRAIVSRYSTYPTGPWSEEKTQVTWDQQPYVYGGFIAEGSSSKPGDLTMTVSRWEPKTSDEPARYDVSQWDGSLK